MMNNNKNELVVKSNRLIEASYRLTLAEQRIILLSIIEARRTETGLTSESILEIRAADYAEMFGITVDQAYEQLKEAGQTLFLRYVVLYDKNQKTGREDKTTVRWVSAVKYMDGNASICIQFAQQMVPYISRLEKEFTLYKLEKVANMSSAYAIRLYELLIQWGSVGYREIELSLFREMLMVVDEYKAIKDLKKRVIDVALSQINEFSDLAVSYTQRKTGRVVTHLIFRFDQKEEPKPEPKQAVKPGFEKTKATKEELAVEFLKNNAKYQKDHANIAPHIAWRTPAIWSQFAGAFDEWACGR